MLGALDLDFVWMLDVGIWVFFLDSSMKTSIYVAFLRGINVGGNTLISMADLKRCFESLGFKNVKTVLASGNVIFEAPQSDLATLTRKIEQKLQSQFGSSITVMLRTSEEIHTLIALAPFKKVKASPLIRLHVSFLPQNVEHSLKVSQRLNGTPFEIFRVSPCEICSVVQPAPKQGTPELMRVLEKEFGKKLTTRTWNTIERIARLLKE
jgi:uncharacterized protein (DUF1697 family)